MGKNVGKMRKHEDSLKLYSLLGEMKGKCEIWEGKSEDEKLVNSEHLPDIHIQTVQYNHGALHATVLLLVWYGTLYGTVPYLV